MPREKRDDTSDHVSSPHPHAFCDGFSNSSAYYLDRMKPTRREWQNDIAAGQRNIVFPDTAANEARLWRSLLVRKWTAREVLGLGLMVLTLVSAFAAVVVIQFQIYNGQGTLGQRIIAAFGAWVMLLAVVAVVLAIVWLSSRIRSGRYNHQKLP